MRMLTGGAALLAAIAAVTIAFNPGQAALAQVTKSKEPPFTFDQGSRTYPVPVYTIPIPPQLREPVTPSPYQDFGPAVTPSPYRDYDSGGQSITITNPLGGIANNLVDLIGYILRIAKGAAAVLAVFMIVYGAYQLLFAAGKPEAVKKAGKTILYAVIGLAVVLMSDLIIDIIKKIVNQSPPQ